MAKLTVTKREEVEARYLAVNAGVRYWEDATVNGTPDDDGDLIPHRDGGAWRPIIDLDAGVVEDWPENTTASIHYKVCDSGTYALLDAERCPISTIDGYVPAIMSPGGAGYGDYIIMQIDQNGAIANWSVDLEAFEGEDA
jgi:hypothetical protein